MTYITNLKSAFFATLMLLSASVFANPEKHVEKEFNVSEMIMHHVMDAHEWHLWGPDHGKGAVSISLPIILIDNDLEIFSSAAFYHGKMKTAMLDSVETHYATANGYALFHEKIYKLNANGELSFHEGHPTNAKPLDLSITKVVFSLLIGALVLCLLAFGTAKYYKKNGNIAPKGISKFIEPFVLMVQNDIAKPNIGHGYKKFVPLLLTFFFFIWVNNMLGLIPLFPGGVNSTGNISIPLVLSMFALVAILAFANGNYWRHIFAMPGVPKPLLIIMIPIEIAGIFIKPIALCIRLFANITAGHIIVLALVSIIFISKNMGWAGLSVPMTLFISVLELLVAFLQAFLFTMLVSLFIGAAVEEAHH